MHPRSGSSIISVMQNLCWVLTLPAILAGTAFGWQAQRAEVKLPPPFATPSSNNRPQVAPRPSGAQLHLPDGFTVGEYASGFDKPRTMIYAPGGEILITESVANGSVVVMTDKTGKPLEKRRKLIEGSGPAVWHGLVERLLVCCRNHIGETV